LKFAERAKHIVTEVKANKIEAVDAELVAKLQREIKYLKEILNIRRKGTSAVNQVNNKLLILQEENERLRQSHLSVNEVEKLMEENKVIRIELQRFRSDHGDSSNPKDFEVTGGLSSFMTKGFGSPMSRSPRESKPTDILDTIQEGEIGELHNRNFGQEHTSFQHANVFDSVHTVDSKNQNFSEMTSPMSSQSHLGATSKISQIAATRSPSEGQIIPIGNLPQRIKGKTNNDIVAEAGKLPRDVQKIEEKKKEQQRALRRLQALEDWQKKMKNKELGLDSSQGRFSEPPLGSETTSVSSSMDKPAIDYKLAEFDKLYDPYKVRQEIEKKYNTKSRVQLPSKNLRTSEDLSRLKNIQKNFF